MRLKITVCRDQSSDMLVMTSSIKLVLKFIIDGQVHKQLTGTIGDVDFLMTPVFRKKKSGCIYKFRQLENSQQKTDRS